MSHVKSHLFTIRHLLSTPPPHKSAPPSYEDNTYIDWMNEAVPPRTNSFKKWSVLVFMAIAMGYTTAVIDVFSAGLNDLKKGICFSRLDRWSLLSPYLTCPSEDWYSWLRLFSGNRSYWLQIVIDLPLYVIFSGLFLLFAGYLTYEKAPLVKQSGIPEIKLIVAGLNYHTSTYLGTKSLFVKATGLVMVVASGAWLGKEGPLTHVACSILTTLFNRTIGEMGFEGLRRELLCAATATGITVAFDSPIGGVLFVMELLKLYFSPMKIMWNSFVTATIALVVLFGSKAFTEGTNFHEKSLFEVSFGNFSWLFTETVPFLVLGLAGGFYGHLYTQAYLKFGNKTRKNRLWNTLSALSGLLPSHGKYLELLLVAVVTALTTFPLSMSRMSLEAFLKVLFTECPAQKVSDVSQNIDFLCDSSTTATIFKLGYILIVGFFLSAYSYGLSLPGGILMPSLVLGGTLGRLVGIISQAIQSKVNPTLLATCTAKSCIVSPSSYAVVGAAAFMTGITKLTVATVVIIFELTGALTYVVPIMVAVITAKIFNDWLSEYNIYDAWIVKEFNTPENPQLAEFNLGKGDGLCKFGSMTAEFTASLPSISVAEAMIPFLETRHLVLFPEVPYSLAEFYSFLSNDTHEGYPVIAREDDVVCVGYVTKQTIYELIVRSIGSSQSAPLLICFTAAMPHLLKKQDFEEEFISRYENINMIWLDVEPPTVMVHSRTSLKQVVELFERLHLNSLLISEYADSTHLAGFIDRFILARLIQERFVNLQYATDTDEESLETRFFDRQDRESIGLIS